MASHAPRLRILSVGGNAVSAFLSWRLQSTNACDVTLVWKSGFESVAQYGISFRSARFGNERFKPRQVVPSPEEAARSMKGSFDYVLLCIKALPDVYDLASIIESVVTPQHTCILINTTHSLGVESYLEERFPKNVVLSLVSQMDINQLGPAEFEHHGATDLWVGPANWNPEIPVSIQADMAEALAMTLGSGQIECKVSKNIQQQQFERMIGPIAFHTTSVIFETPNHADLLGLTGVRSLVSDTIAEVVRIAEARGCSFPSNFKEKTMEDMIRPRDTLSIMYQDYTSKRPMEVETYLGSPIKIAQRAGVKVPRIETLYAMLHHVNLANQRRPSAPVNTSPVHNAPPPAPRTVLGPAPPPRGAMQNGSHVNGVANNPMPLQGAANGSMPGPMPNRGGRTPSLLGGGPPMRRGPAGPNGYPQQMANGMMPHRGNPQVQGRPSFDMNGNSQGNANGLDQFSHLVLYDNPSNGYSEQPGVSMADPPMGAPQDLALRERELMIRQKEIALREREMSMQRPMRGPMGPPMRGPGPGMNQGPMPRPPPSHIGVQDDDDDDGEDCFDPTAYRGPPVDPDNVDMMSITSRRTRKQPSAGQLRHNPEMDGSRRGTGLGRFVPARTRGGSTMNGMANIPGVHDSLMSNPLMAYSSDRYGAVDRSQLGAQSRTNSLTAARLNELSGTGYGGYPTMPAAVRRTSQSPADPFGAAGRLQGRPPPPQHRFPSNGPPPNGIPNGVPNGLPLPEVRQPTPRHPPGHGNSVAPQEVEQRAGVSNLYPPKIGPQVRSLTGSASASAGSGDSGRSANIDSETSAYSSQSSLGPRAAAGIR